MAGPALAVCPGAGFLAKRSSVANSSDKAFTVLELGIVADGYAIILAEAAGWYGTSRMAHCHAPGLRTGGEPVLLARLATRELACEERYLYARPLPVVFRRCRAARTAIAACRTQIISAMAKRHSSVRRLGSGDAMIPPRLHEKCSTASPRPPRDEAVVWGSTPGPVALKPS